MARYRESLCRLCRSEGIKLFEKGDRCFTEKCALNEGLMLRANMVRAAGESFSDYGVQMREKQKLKRMFGLLERQFRNYFRKSGQAEGRHRFQPPDHAGEKAGQCRIQDGFCQFKSRSQTACPAQPFHRQRQEGKYSFLPGRVPGTRSGQGEKPEDSQDTRILGDSCTARHPAMAGTG